MKKIISLIPGVALALGIAFIARILENLENAADVRVLGAIGVLELKAKPSAEDILKVIRETGVWLRPFCNYVYTMPPFITTDAEIDRICEAIKKIGECEPAPVTDDDEFHE